MSLSFSKRRWHVMCCEGDRIGGADRHHATLSNFAVLPALPRIARSRAGLLMASLTRAVVMSGDAKMRIQDFLQITRCHGVPSRAGAADAALRYRGLTPRDPVVRVQDRQVRSLSNWSTRWFSPRTRLRRRRALLDKKSAAFRDYTHSRETFAIGQLRAHAPAFRGSDHTGNGTVRASTGESALLAHDV
jgi:hypothetical protein